MISAQLLSGAGHLEVARAAPAVFAACSAKYPHMRRSQPSSSPSYMDPWSRSIVDYVWGLVEPIAKFPHIGDVTF
jgi:hypothetical protein